MEPFTPAMLETIWWLSFSTISILVAGGYTYRKFALKRHVKQVRQLAHLEQYRLRLGELTNKLLADANELDQKSKFANQSTTEAWSRELGVICDELVKVSEILPLIDDLLERNKIDEGLDSIERTTNMVEKISRQLQQVQNSAPKLLGDKRRD